MGSSPIVGTSSHTEDGFAVGGAVLFYTSRRTAHLLRGVLMDRLLAGLTTAQVEAQIAQGNVNVDPSPKTRTVGQIVRDNLCTLFNAVNLFLAVLVFTTGSYRNMLFMLIVVANAAIGIYQEVRSKRALDKLALIAARPVTVIRDGKEVQIPVDAIVLGDLVCLSHGAQVPADLEVQKGACFMNESLLTGESDAVAKGPGDLLLSGSFVVSGAVEATAVAVGEKSYAGRLGAEAKQSKPVRSEIMATLRFIVKLGTYVLVPVGLILFTRSFFSGESYSVSILSTVAAVVGMIPQGLILLTSTVLAIATFRLAQRQVLVQQLYCIETLARVDVLCLDKTGTITSGAMKVTRLIPLAPHVSAAEKPVPPSPLALSGAAPLSAEDALAISEPGLSRVLQALADVMGANAQDANETAKAALDYLSRRQVSPGKIVREIPFSSQRKYSGCVTEHGAFAVGARQFLKPVNEDQVDAALATLPKDARKLVICQVDGFSDKDEVQGAVVALGVMALADEIRATAPETLKYFIEQGVKLLVISGDDPATVASIAGQAGVPDASDYVDATTLATPESIAKAAEAYRVFGRVTPEQKRDLVKALKSQGHTVAMTGDGVNDVLALREADCSVAMASGSDAARTVAEIVLVDNDFSSMPHVLAEGRRSINNLQRSASLFLVKTVFSMAVAVLCIFFPPYPLLPIQLTLVSGTMTGIPSFVLALEPNRDRVKGHFLANVLARSVPASAGITLGLAALVLLRDLLGFTGGQVSTIATCLVAVMGALLVWRISQPLTPLRFVLIVVICGLCAAGILLFGWIFEIAQFTVVMLLFLAIALALAAFVFWVFYNRGVDTTEDGSGPYVELAKKIQEADHGVS